MNITAPETLDVGFVLACAAVVFLMQAGFCLVESGLVRSKNSINVAVKNALDCALSILLYTCFGFAVMFGTSVGGWFGNPFSFNGIATDPSIQAFLILQLVFCGATATIISGAVAERIKLKVYLFITCVVSTLIYPIVGHWVWGGALEGTGQGWLAQMGFIDWGGAAAVHVVGGFAALAAALVIGPRRLRTNQGMTGGYSLTLAVLGCFILWFGWWGFNAGSGLSISSLTPRILLNTNLGAVSGATMAAFLSYQRCGKVQVTFQLTGIIAGLVSVTSACHMISPFAAIVAGAMGATVAIWFKFKLIEWKIDDAVSAFATHGAAGIWGVLVVALFGFSDQMSVGSRSLQFLVQFAGANIAALVSFGGIWCSLKLLSLVTDLRVTDEEETLGLNVVEHGATNDVTDLLMTMHDHGQSGDYSKDIEVVPHTETGQIATEYNRVLAKVREEIEDHRQTNSWLESERNRLASVFTHAGIGIYQLDLEGRFTAVNDTLLEMFEYESESELIGESVCDGIWHGDGSMAAKTLAVHFKNKKVMSDCEFKVDLKGQQRWTLESLVPVHDSEGKLNSWLGTVHDITERKMKALAEIEIANAKSEAKGQFLANMSHEIRTPLNGVIGMLDLLLASELDYRSDHYVTVAKSSANSLLAVVNDILDFSKIEAGHLELEKIPFEIREVIESTAEQFAYKAHEKSLELNCSISEDVPYAVLGDPERLRQVLINLMGNAVKFTETGEINLCVSARGSKLKFSIQDTGIGMTSECVSSLFRSFTQADTSTTRKYGGTGLGLAISQKLIELMGGKIEVKSKLDQGSEFWFEIEMPIDRHHVPAPQQENNPAIEKLKDVRVLVVDDNDTNCEILSNQMGSWGMQVTICKESVAAVDRLVVANRIQQPIELVVLDFCMPEMNGRDVARAIRQNRDLDSVAILMLSSSYELMSPEDLVEFGIQSAMTKPARQSMLLQSICKIVSERPTYHRDSTIPGISNNLPSNGLQVELPSQTALHAMESFGLPTATPSQISSPEVAPSQETPYWNRLVADSPQEQVSQSDVSNGVPSSQQVSQAQTELVGQTEPVPTTNNVPTNAATNSSTRKLAADVLIADDNQVNRLVAERMLTSQGYTVDMACDGQEALDKVKTSQYRLILMDGHMPRLDGLSATREIRSWERDNPEVSRTPIVALTANIVQGIKKKCYDAGMDAYLSKPILLESLMAVVTQYAQAPTESKVEAPISPGDVLPFAPPVYPLAGAALEHEQLQGKVQELIATDRLKEQCGGDNQFAIQLLQIMRESLPEQLSNLGTALEQEDLQEAWGIAHQLKGAAGDSCLVAIFDTAAKLEQEAKLGKAEQVLELNAVLHSRVEQTLSAISALIQELN